MLCQVIEVLVIIGWTCGIMGPFFFGLKYVSDICVTYVSDMPGARGTDAQSHLSCRPLVVGRMERKKDLRPLPGVR